MAYIQLKLLFVCFGLAAATLGEENVARELQSLKDEIRSLHSELAAIKGELHELKSLSKYQDTNPGFTVYADAIQVASNGDVINFGGEITNFGSHFDTATSTFTCAFSGTYFFALSLRSDQNVLDAAIMINDVTQVAVRVRDVYHTESSSLVVACNEGDTVHIEATGTAAVYGDANASLRVSTFSGFLLRLYI